MKKNLMIALTLAAPACVAAQTAVDAMSISQGDLRGTARFMSMAGAFTALGGDMSTLNQNPGGIGVYRSSDIALTLDLNPQSVTSKADGLSDKTTQTKFGVNNFGYIGAVNTGSETMPFFNWGVSYSRAASFDRHYGGRLGSIGTSLTNLVADYTNADPYRMTQEAFLKDNVYFNSLASWTSILMNHGYGINPTSFNSEAANYIGMFDYGTTGGEGWYDINEKGHVDEYSINLGGNVMDILYWGIGFGITDIDYKQYAYYAESFYDCNVPAYRKIAGKNEYGYLAPDPENPTPNTGDYGLSNYKHIWGSGFNFKAGVIVKPINEFRIGLAVHTPTYYNLSYEGNATMAFGYNSPLYNQSEIDMMDDGETSTEWSEFDWKLKSPWRLMIGAAGVLGGRAIISADYEYRAYGDMTVKDWEGFGCTDVNDDIKHYYQSTNIIRIGAEYRLTPSWSVRAGYSYETSPVKSELLDPSGDQATYVYTSGPDDYETQPAFTLDRSTTHVTCGVGYKYKNVYADLAYVYRHRSADYHAFTDYNMNEYPNQLVVAPTAKLSDNNSQVVLTLGVRF